MQTSRSVRLPGGESGEYVEGYASRGAVVSIVRTGSAHRLYVCGIEIGRTSSYLEARALALAALAALATGGRTSDRGAVHQ